MSTSRFVKLIDMPERTWRRWQAKARQGQGPKGPWPQPARSAARDLVVGHALAKPVWGHRKIWALTRHDGHKVSQATVLRLLRDEGLLLASQSRSSAVNSPPTVEPRSRRCLMARTRCGNWTSPSSRPPRAARGGSQDAGTGTDKYEHPWHVSPTGNKHDAIAAVELALADYEALFGHPLADACPINEITGEVLPVVTIVTDNGGPFRSIDFELFITSHPELQHVRTRVKSPGQNGSRERGFGTLKYERLFLDEIPDALTLVERAEDYRIEYNTQRPHEAIAWNRPLEVHLGRASTTVPTFEQEEVLPTT
ncbi:integrase core domain-containing protein [Brooklawnia propionicigenes]|jgi:transposase InsO family protein|nr:MULTISPECIES: integrase core domain-containing protein [Propionibacteriales]